jgi:putative FmdB family regulatory protein
MPIYEFRCDVCGERFEQLVAAETASLECPRCGAERTERVYSAQASPFSLVKTPGEARRQERRNAALNRRAKADFSRSRRRAEQARRQSGGNRGR